MRRRGHRSECSLCQYWQSRNRPSERFSLFFGLFVFDVDAAKKLIRRQKVQAQRIPVEDLKNWGQWPPPRWRHGRMSLFLFGGGIDYSHARHVNPNEPIIIGWTRLRPKRNRCLSSLTGDTESSGRNGPDARDPGVCARERHCRTRYSSQPVGAGSRIFVTE